MTPFGKNILFQPKSKDKIIGDTARFYLYGEVLAIGDKVESIKVGETIIYTQWGLNKAVMADGTEHFFVKEDDDYILGVIHAS
jgi:co-chaperonin GroES (HSP10)